MNSNVPDALLPIITKTTIDSIEKNHKEIEELQLSIAELEVKLQERQSDNKKMVEYLHYLEGQNSYSGGLIQDIGFNEYDKAYSRPLKARFILNKIQKPLTVPEIITELKKIEPDMFSREDKYYVAKFHSTLKQNIDESKEVYFFRIKNKNDEYEYHLKEWE